MILFKRCENCNGLGFKWTIRRQRIYVVMLRDFVTGRLAICGKCRKKVESALKERNI